MSIFAPGIAIKLTASTAWPGYAKRLPVRGRSYRSPVRLAIRLLFRKNPPTGFCQVASHCNGCLAVSFGGFESLIQIHHVASLQLVLMDNDAVGRLDEGPLQKKIGATWHLSMPGLSARTMYRGNESGITGQMGRRWESVNITDLQQQRCP